MWRGIVCEAVDEIVLEQFLRHLLHELVCDVSSAYSRLTPYPPTSYLFVSRRSGESHCKLCFLPTANIPIYIRECTFTSIRPHIKRNKNGGKQLPTYAWETRPQKTRSACCSQFGCIIFNALFLLYYDCKYYSFTPMFQTPSLCVSLGELCKSLMFLRTDIL